MPGYLLGAPERERLEHVATETPNDRARRRARLLLLYDDGLLTHAAARGAGMSDGWARYWKRQYHARDLAIFFDTSPAPSEEPEPGAPFKGLD
jgi:hypothetical protein